MPLNDGAYGDNGAPPTARWDKSHCFGPGFFASSFEEDGDKNNEKSFFFYYKLSDAKNQKRRNTKVSAWRNSL